jgi:acid stress-induced BolA-like protein IbaG/YrbA
MFDFNDFDFNFDFDGKKEDNTALLLMIENYKKYLKNYPYNFKELAEEFLLIKNKDAGIVPFVLNEWQEQANEFVIKQYETHGFIDILTIKGRQGGMTTFYTGFLIYKALADKVNVGFVADNGKNAQIIFEMATLMLLKIFELGLETQGKGHFGKLIIFDNWEKTSLRFYSAEGGKIRGGTVGAILNDELGERTDILELEGLAKKKGAIHIKNGTPKGTGNNLHLLYTNSKNQNELDKVLFLPWYRLKQYELNKPYEKTDKIEEYLLKYGLQDLSETKKSWLYDKYKEIALNYPNAVEKINQEYPPNIEVGFTSSAENCFCEPELINKAFVKKDCIIKHNEIIIGIDIAGGGDTSTVAIRKGDYCEFEILKHNSSRGGLQATEKVEALKNMLLDILNKSPIDTSILINYDKTGAVGINFDDVIIPMINFLRKSGHEVSCKGVHFNQTIITREFDGEKRINARNTIYMNLRKWFLTESVFLIDKFNKLQEELLATKIETVNGEVRITKKEKIKQGLGRSPDFADALALCFFPQDAMFSIGSYQPRSAYLPIDDGEYGY